MKSIEKLKKNGNKAFSEGRFQEACQIYGQCIEGLITLEASGSGESLGPIFENAKITLFLNLALSNLKLGSYEGCRRCCNAALVFCNKPSLKLSDLGVDDDLTEDIAVSLQDVKYTALTTKCLFRRSQCLVDLGEFDNALRDLKSAECLSPEDPTIKKAIADIR